MFRTWANQCTLPRELLHWASVSSCALKPPNALWSWAKTESSSLQFRSFTVFHLRNLPPDLHSMAIQPWNSEDKKKLLSFLQQFPRLIRCTRCTLAKVICSYNYTNSVGDRNELSTAAGSNSGLPRTLPRPAQRSFRCWDFDRCCMILIYTDHVWFCHFGFAINCDLRCIGKMMRLSVPSWPHCCLLCRLLQSFLICLFPPGRTYKCTKCTSFYISPLQKFIRFKCCKLCTDLILRSFQCNACHCFFVPAFEILKRHRW